MKFFKLWEPLSIGELTLRNRIVMPAMHLNYADDGFVNEQVLAFYQRRAQGGVGLITVGGIGIDKKGEGVPAMISIQDDKFIPGLTQLTTLVHSEGAKIGAQLYHAGAYAFRQLTGETPVSSSAVYSRFTHDTPRELKTEEIPEIHELFCQAAGRAVDAKFDVIELLSSAGYLIDQFLSPLKNKRTDKYGGPKLEDRLPFALELIDKVKSQINGKAVLGARFSGDDFVPGSNTYHEKIEIAKAYENAGLQYLNVTGGWHETRVPQIPMDVPKGAFTYLAKEIKNHVHLKIIASNRINDPILAENLLQDSFADGICMGRPLIVDPDLPLKVKNNSIQSIRRCLGCNCCFDSVFAMSPVKCSINPYAGYEVMFKNPEMSQKRKLVIVIGAGPAGLEAARTARSLGHRVSLYEQSSIIGGQINAAWIPPGREELRNLMSYYEENLKEIGVEFHLGERLTCEKIMNLHPDQVYFATGVFPNKPPIPGLDGSKGSDICFADDALMGDHPIGKKVVILGGAATGVETAIWAAKKGAMDPNVARFLSFYDALPIEDAMKRTYRGNREVHIVEMLPKIATSVGKSTRWMFLDELEKLGVHVHTNAKITDLDHDIITFISENATQSINRVDTFINATGVKPNRDFYTQFKSFLDQQPKSESTIDIQLIGDAKKVGNILDAVTSGFRAAWKLGKAPNS